MSTFSSVIALLATIATALSLMIVWGGTEAIHLDWVAMPDDYSQTEFQALLHPPETTYAATSAPEADTPPPPEGVDRVLWINISGFRSDYVEESSTPFFDQISDRGHYTNELSPVFPTLEYPNLISQATGVPASVHGIFSNAFRDPETMEVLERPTRLGLLGGVEPIWTTAKRQGLAVLVHDWPFSQEQPAEHAADIHLSEYDPGRTDQERLDALLEAWSSHEGEEKIRLAMASLKDLEKAGRSFGSREEDTYQAVSKLDGLLRDFFDKLEEKWPELSNPGDTLYILLTTDHGMTDADKIINYAELMGDLAESVDYAVNDAVAHIWFNEPPEGTTMEKFLEDYDEELNARIYWRAYEPGDYPSFLELGEGGPLLGDRLLVLKSGYAFTTKKGSEPVFAPSEVGGPYAASGYSVRDNARMNGQAFIFQLTGGYGSNLGRITPMQLYPTVCRILEIEPAPGASTEALSVK